MPNVYVEARPMAVREGRSRTSWSRIHADHVLATFKTQKEAIDGGRKKNHSGCRASGILATRKSPTTGAPPSSRGTGFLSDRSFAAA